MSIGSDIARIKNAKSDIISAINAKGGSASGLKIDQLATQIAGLPTGGSTGQAFQMDYGTVSYLGSSWTLNLGFVPQVVNLLIKRNNATTRFVVGYCAGRGATCWQSNDTGGYHQYTTATVSGNSITFNFKTNAGAALNVSDIMWSAAGYAS